MTTTPTHSPSPLEAYREQYGIPEGTDLDDLVEKIFREMEETRAAVYYDYYVVTNGFCSCTMCPESALDRPDARCYEPISDSIEAELIEDESE